MFKVVKVLQILLKSNVEPPTMSSEVAGFCCDLLLRTMVEVERDRTGKFLLHQLEQQRGSRARVAGGGREGRTWREGSTIFPDRKRTGTSHLLYQSLRGT